MTKILLTVLAVFVINNFASENIIKYNGGTSNLFLGDTGNYLYAPSFTVTYEFALKKNLLLALNYNEPKIRVLDSIHPTFFPSLNIGLTYHYYLLEKLFVSSSAGGGWRWDDHRGYGNGIKPNFYTECALNIKLIDGVFLGPYYSYYSGFNNTIFKNGISTIGVTGGIDLDISWGGIKGYSNNTIQGELFDKQNSYTKAKWSLLNGMAFTGIATTFLVFAHIFFVEGFIYTEGDEMSVALAKFLTPVTLGISMASAGIAIPLYTHYYKVNH